MRTYRVTFYDSQDYLLLSVDVSARNPEQAQTLAEREFPSTAAECDYVIVGRVLQENKGYFYVRA